MIDWIAQAVEHPLCVRYQIMSQHIMGKMAFLEKKIFEGF